MTGKRFAYPETVEAALALLAGNPRAIPVGGGTVVATEESRDIELFVDVTRCGLDTIELAEDNLFIGAGVRVADLHQELLGDGPEATLIHEAAQGIATLQLRHAITVGGNITHLCSWADLPVAFLALDAVVHVARHGGDDLEIPFAEWVEKHPRRILEAGDLVTGVSVPLPPIQRGACYGRFRVTATENPLITVAAVISLEDETVVQADVVVGAIGPKPKRAEAVEAALEDATLSPETLALAASKAASSVTVAPNFRMEQAVRARILEPIVRRTLEAAAKRATQGGEA